MDGLIYICIATHGAFISSRHQNSLLMRTEHSTISPPRDLNVTKFTIAVPGTTGQNFSAECKKAYELLKRNPDYPQEKMTQKLKEIFIESIPSRKATNQEWRDKKEAFWVDTAASPSLSGKIETGSRFMNKSFQVDESPSSKLYSVKILNGPLRGSNIIEYDFLLRSGVDLYKLRINENRFTTLSNGKKLLIDFTLDDLFKILVELGINDVYIIDPSCNVDDEHLDETQQDFRANRAARRTYTKNEGFYNNSFDNPFTENFVRDDDGNLVSENVLKKANEDYYGQTNEDYDEPVKNNCTPCKAGVKSSNNTDLGLPCCPTIVNQYLGLTPKNTKQNTSSSYLQPPTSYKNSIYSSVPSGSNEFKQYDTVFVMLNGKMQEGSIRKISGIYAEVDFDPTTTDGVEFQVFKLDELRKNRGGSKTKRKRYNRKHKSKKHKNKKYHTKKYYKKQKK